MTGTAAPEFPWLLPAALTTDPEAGDRRPRRSTRDWIVDTLFFLNAVGFTALAAWDLHRPDSTMLNGNPIPGWAYGLDVTASFACCLALWVRRRWPVQLALVTLPLAFFSVASVLTVMIILFTVAVHRRLAVAAPFAAAGVLGSMVYTWLRPDPDLPYWVAVAFSAAIVASVLAWGMFVRARRQLVVSLRDRAHRAEAEQRLRVAQARHLERTRIAREMHDVLAHRISLVSLHAGALEFRPDAAPEEVARAAGVIRTSAHQALEDLREVIGLLRDDTTGAGPERPQPTLADLPALVAESRAAGMRVDVRNGVAEPGAVPAGIGRSAYRIVQEGLTNARKHAPGAVVTVTVAGAPGAGVTVEVCNRRPVGRVPAARIPGAGTGLVGLAERTSLVGGRLEYGRTDAGDYRLGAWLPWPA